MDSEKIYKNFLRKLTKDLVILPDKKEENPKNTILALWHYASGNPVSAINAEKLNLPPLLPSQISVLRKLVKSRLSGTPLAHLIHRQNFMGLDYIINDGDYIPRKETELLARTAINTISKNYKKDQNIVVLDLCTGIGTIALAIAHYCKNTSVFGSDILKASIDTADKNAKFFSLENRTAFFNADMFDAFEGLKGNIQVIVSAPPYISTGKIKKMPGEIANHEPKEAFDAGPFGLSVFLILISVAPQYLLIGGYLIIECGLGQGEFLTDRIKANECFGSIVKIYDDEGNIRVIKAKKIA
jgi:release factor glutamine methyltransferase